MVEAVGGWCKAHGIAAGGMTSQQGHPRQCHKGLLLPARGLRAASWGLTPTATSFMTWLQDRAGGKAGP